MKREFLEELGLSRESIDAVMAEHGKSVGGYRSRCEELARSLSEAEERLLSLTSERTAWQAERGDFVRFREGVIDEMITEAAPTSPLVAAELKRRLSEAPNGELRACLASLRSSFPEAFAPVGGGGPLFSLPSTPAPEEGMVMRVFRRR